MASIHQNFQSIGFQHTDNFKNCVCDKFYSPDSLLGIINRNSDFSIFAEIIKKLNMKINSEMIP